MEFYDKIFQVLRNFMEYGNYQGKEENAIKVIIKRFPEKSKEECTKVFRACYKAYKEAIVLVKENNAYYAQKNSITFPYPEIFFRKKHSEVPEKMLTSIIGWIYHWHHER